VRLDTRVFRFLIGGCSLAAMGWELMGFCHGRAGA